LQRSAEGSEGLAAVHAHDEARLQVGNLEGRYDGPEDFAVVGFVVNDEDARAGGGIDAGRLDERLCL